MRIPRLFSLPGIALAEGGSATGDGDLTAKVAEVEGTGTREITGTGALTAQDAVVAGTATRTVWQIYQVLIEDPEFTIDDTSVGGENAWFWFTDGWEIVDGQMIGKLSGKICADNFPFAPFTAVPIAGEIYNVKYRFSGLTPMALVVVGNNQSAFKETGIDYDYDIAATETSPNTRVFSSTITDYPDSVTEVDYFYLQTSIPTLQAQPAAVSGLGTVGRVGTGALLSSPAVVAGVAARVIHNDGPELLNDTGFDDASKWNLAYADVNSTNASKLTIAAEFFQDGMALQNVGLIEGETYLVRFTIEAAGTSAALGAYIGKETSGWGQPGTYERVATAGPSPNLGLMTGGIAGGYFTVDNIRTFRVLTLQAQQATMSGTGVVGRFGTGTLTAQDAAIIGASKRTLTGAGVLTAQDAGVAGTAVRGVIGTVGFGADAQPAQVAGTGTREITGTGALTAQDAVVAGTATRTVWQINQTLALDPEFDIEDFSSFGLGGWKWFQDGWEITGGKMQSLLHARIANIDIFNPALIPVLGQTYNVKYRFSGHSPLLLTIVGNNDYAGFVEVDTDYDFDVICSDADYGDTSTRIYGAYYGGAEATYDDICHVEYFYLQSSIPTIQAQPAAVSGSGTVGRVGTGSIAAQDSAVAGTAERMVWQINHTLAADPYFTIDDSSVQGENDWIWAADTWSISNGNLVPNHIWQTASLVGPTSGGNFRIGETYRVEYKFLNNDLFLGSMGGRSLPPEEVVKDVDHVVDFTATASTSVLLITGTTLTTVDYFSVKIPIPTLQAQPAAVSGAGVVGRVGTGALTVQDAAIAGNSQRTVIGEGVLECVASEVSGTGVRTVWQIEHVVAADPYFTIDDSSDLGENDWEWQTANLWTISGGNLVPNSSWMYAYLRGPTSGRGGNLIVGQPYIAKYKFLNNGIFGGQFGGGRTIAPGERFEDIDHVVNFVAINASKPNLINSNLWATVDYFSLEIPIPTIQAQQATMSGAGIVGRFGTGALTAQNSAVAGTGTRTVWQIYDDLIADPEFAIEDTSANGTGDWYWYTNSWEIVDGKMTSINMAVKMTLVGDQSNPPRSAILGHTYNIRFRLSGTLPLVTVLVGNQQPGLQLDTDYDLNIVATNDDSDGVSAFVSHVTQGTNVDYFYCQSAIHTLQAQPVSVSGTGEVARTGTGALTSQIVAVSGEGVIQSAGTGALTAQNSAVAGTGTRTVWQVNHAVLSDPEFAIDDSSQNGVGDWTWPAYQVEIVDGAITSILGSTYSLVLAPVKHGDTYNVRFRFSTHVPMGVYVAGSFLDDLHGGPITFEVGVDYDLDVVADVGGQYGGITALFYEWADSSCDYFYLQSVIPTIQAQPVAVSGSGTVGHVGTGSITALTSTVSGTGIREITNVGEDVGLSNGDFSALNSDTDAVDWIESDTVDFSNNTALYEGAFGSIQDSSYAVVPGATYEIEFDILQDAGFGTWVTIGNTAEGWHTGIGHKKVTITAGNDLGLIFSWLVASGIREIDNVVLRRLGHIQAQPAAVSGSGTVGRVGTGSITAQVSAITGSVERQVIGAGGLTAQASVIAGVAVREITAVGNDVLSNGDFSNLNSDTDAVDWFEYGQLRDFSNNTFLRIGASSTGIVDESHTPVPGARYIVSFDILQNVSVGILVQVGGVVLNGGEEILGHVGETWTEEIVAVTTGALNIGFQYSFSSTTREIDNVVLCRLDNVQAQSATMAGAGAVGHTGTGTLTAQNSAVLGTVEREVIGTGTLTSQIAAISGEGVVEEWADITGSGTPTAQASAVSGTGIRTVNGTGSLTALVAEVAGTVEREITGSGILTTQLSVVSGTVEREITGSGGCQARTATITGEGHFIFDGTGAIEARTVRVRGVWTIGLYAGVRITMDRDDVITLGRDDRTAMEREDGITLDRNDRFTLDKDATITLDDTG